MVLIKIKDGHQLNGDGEKLGKDSSDIVHTFWKSMGHMEVPLDLAINLERERPQRYEIVDKKLANKLLVEFTTPIKEEVKINPKIDINVILDQVEKIIDLNKSEQISLLKELKIDYDQYAKEFDRVRKIILSGYKL